MSIQSLVGMIGIVRRALAPHGTVQVNGELWSAEPVKGEENLPLGAHVQIVQVDGLVLQVRKNEEEKVPGG